VVRWFGDFTTNKEIRIGDLVTVPYVVELSRPSAAHYIGEAGLVPRFTGATNADESYVGSQKPPADSIVRRGSTVTLVLAPGFPP
jgi:beta-lactam-binding protein with PASTA domain